MKQETSSERAASNLGGPPQSISAQDPSGHHRAETRLRSRLMGLISMVSANRMLSSSVIVATGMGVELGSQLVRTLILAHMLDAREFGLVASVNTLFSLIAMSSAIGMDRYLVYAQDGGSPLSLNVAHTLSLISALLGALLLVIAEPTARLMGEPEAAGSFAMVALILLVRGCMHLGVMQMQRNKIFWPSVVPDTIGAILGLVAATVAAMIVPDHRAILWGLGTQTAVMTIASHFLARGLRYRLSLDRAATRAALRFCLPFAANGFALAMAYQLDRLIVGAWLGVVALGTYTLLLTLLMQPLALVLRLFTTMMQPALSSAWHDDPHERFTRMVHRSVVVSGLFGLTCAAGTICLGVPIWKLMFGGRFAVDEIIFILMGVLVMLRMLRGSLNLIGLAIGNTTGLIVSNLAGCSGLAVTCVALLFYPVLESAVSGLLVAELLSLVVVALRLKPVLHLQDRTIIRELFTITMLPFVLSAWVLAVDPNVTWRFIAAALITGLCLVQASRQAQFIRSQGILPMR